MIDKINKWWITPASKGLQTGKIYTNGDHLRMDLRETIGGFCLGCIIMLFLILLEIPSWDNSLITYGICHSNAPSGFHIATWDKNYTCTYSNGTSTKVVKYIFDNTFNNYVPS